MNKVLGTQMIVENRPGAGGMDVSPFLPRIFRLRAIHSDRDADVLLLATGSVDETPIDHANDTPDSIAVRCVV